MLIPQYKICSVDDAFEVLERYGLELLDWGDGTPEGFAVFLFDFGRVEGSDHIALLAHSYRQSCTEYAREGKSFDAKLRLDNEGTMEWLKEKAEVRRALVRTIREIKVGPNGGHVWRAIAQLATTPAHLRLCPDAGGSGFLDHLEEALDKLRPFLTEFDDWPTWTIDPQVAEGALLAMMIRTDIQRLDTTLVEAPPWSGNEPHMSNELASLLKLVADEQFARALTASTAKPADMASTPGVFVH